MARKYRDYSDEDVTKTAAKVSSMAQLLDKLDLKVAGGNYANMKRTLQRLEVNCDHWKGQAWSKGEQLKDWSQYTRVAHLKLHLITKRGHQCERCQRKNWQGEPIPLEVDHINGDRTDNREENLKLYCPNCHALTPTWKKKQNQTTMNNDEIKRKNKAILLTDAKKLIDIARNQTLSQLDREWTEIAANEDHLIEALERLEKCSSLAEADLDAVKTVLSLVIAEVRYRKFSKLKDRFDQ